MSNIEIHRRELSQQLRSRIREIIDDRRISDVEFYDRVTDIVTNISTRLFLIQQLQEGIDDAQRNHDDRN